MPLKHSHQTESMHPPRKKKKAVQVKQQLINHLQTFLWRFEQGGYSVEAMRDVLAAFRKFFERDGREMGGEVEMHIRKMVDSCQAYVEGKGCPRDLVKWLNRLEHILNK